MCEAHIQRQVHVFDDDVDGELFLRRLEQQWQDHCRQTVIAYVCLNNTTKQSVLSGLCRTCGSGRHAERLLQTSIFQMTRLRSRAGHVVPVQLCGWAKFSTLDHLLNLPYVVTSGATRIWLGGVAERLRAIEIIEKCTLTGRGSGTRYNRDSSIDWLIQWFPTCINPRSTNHMLCMKSNDALHKGYSRTVI